MIEMIYEFNLCSNPNPINISNLAEGPGGFIEALAYLRQNPSDKYHGMTLIDKKNNKVPGWKKAELFLANFWTNISTRK